MMWKKAAVAYFKLGLLYWHLQGGTDKTTKNVSRDSSTNI
jgi:hypothetical protein